ncbi:hypothetical protein PGT21_023157 [Puccinia graminis f. sp. tritici]|uniref:Uncharacterized protein n=1 Tax=Puccinia graminis f. sp. tritici TaxID=56615 RepID=A0A5B0LY42_PUCGR|nr:hypothetical protein PGTUg99_027636 [Puccinia graminis f. sp. tritici]KAA1104427.1 hypothetical protein PGT21_023157 [Puccinia graminis f. sp. tritici]
MKIHRFTRIAISGWAFVGHLILSAPEPHPMVGGSRDLVTGGAAANDLSKGAKGLGGAADASQAAQDSAQMIHGANSIPDPTVTSHQAGSASQRISEFRETGAPPSGHSDGPKGPHGDDPNAAHTVDPNAAHTGDPNAAHTENPNTPHTNDPNAAHSTTTATTKPNSPPSRVKVVAKQVAGVVLAPVVWVLKGFAWIREKVGGWVGRKWANWLTARLYKAAPERLELETFEAAKLKAEKKTWLGKAADKSGVNRRIYTPEMQNSVLIHKVPHDQTNLYAIRMWFKKTWARFFGRNKTAQVHPDPGAGPGPTPKAGDPNSASSAATPKAGELNSAGSTGTPKAGDLNSADSATAPKAGDLISADSAAAPTTGNLNSAEKFHNTVDRTSTAKPENQVPDNDPATGTVNSPEGDAGRRVVKVGSPTVDPPTGGKNGHTAGNTVNNQLIPASTRDAKLDPSHAEPATETHTRVPSPQANEILSPKGTSRSTLGTIGHVAYEIGAFPPRQLGRLFKYITGYKGDETIVLASKTGPRPPKVNTDTPATHVNPDRTQLTEHAPRKVENEQQMDQRAGPSQPANSDLEPKVSSNSVPSQLNRENGAKKRKRDQQHDFPRQRR